MSYEILYHAFMYMCIYFTLILHFYEKQQQKHQKLDLNYTEEFLYDLNL